MKSILLLMLVVVAAFQLSCKKSDVQPANTTVTHFKVVVLGSSTAAGTGASTLDSAWVYLLKARLATYNTTTFKDTLVNLAVGGYTTYQLMPSGFKAPANRPLPDTLHNVTRALSLKPDLVIINLPSNDFANGYATDEVLDNYEAIIPLLTAHNIPYIITCTQPRNLDQLAERQRIKAFNDVITNVYSSSHIINYYDKLATTDLKIETSVSAGDGIHLNNKGHNIIYQAFISYAPLKQYLNIK
jgi:acyl-CoA thioesterase-1